MGARGFSRPIRKTIQHSVSADAPRGAAVSALQSVQAVTTKGIASRVENYITIPHKELPRFFPNTLKGMILTTAHRFLRFVAYNAAWSGIGAIVLVVGVGNVIQPQFPVDFGFIRDVGQENFVQEVEAMPKMTVVTPILTPSLFFVSGYNSVPGADIEASIYRGVGGPADNEIFISIEDATVVASSSPLTIAASANQRKKIEKYIVQDGDTPSSIAAAFGITTNTLLWANSLRDGDYIRQGQELSILPVSGVSYQVKSGDTLLSISKQFNGNASAVIAYNKLASSGDLSAGETIIIPDGEMPKRQYALASSRVYTYGGQDLGGYFLKPAAGYISQGLHPNNAVDIANACWTPVYAAAEGTVVIADSYGWNGGYGQYVRIRHPNGVETVYSHAIKLVVSAGQKVTRGQLIEYMGETGRATGCHVHWEVYGAKNPLR
ncbi:MAG: peptidoglycan DD-metalloendopeptidase family protein [Candidatus Spechtbacteria bacterium]|nr:peptidoglycan DD-metalloendopeptidase family protein [Candidatus Spechtbacteria bacterium]